jgi:hypothetical protein
MKNSISKNYMTNEMMVTDYFQYEVEMSIQIDVEQYQNPNEAMVDIMTTIDNLDTAGAVVLSLYATEEIGYYLADVLVTAEAENSNEGMSKIYEAAAQVPGGALIVTGMTVADDDEELFEEDTEEWVEFEDEIEMPGEDMMMSGGCCGGKCH